MKKKILVAVGIPVVLVVGFLMWNLGEWLWIRHQGLTPPDPETDYYSECIDYLNESVSFRLMVYGEEIAFRDSLTYETISDLKEETLTREEDYVYLIFNNLNNTHTVTNEDIDDLNRFADRNANFSYIYLGEKGTLTPDGDVLYTSMDGDLSYGYLMEEGERFSVGGIWTTEDAKVCKQNPEWLSERMIWIIRKAVESNE